MKAAHAHSLLMYTLGLIHCSRISGMLVAITSRLVTFSEPPSVSRTNRQKPKSDILAYQGPVVEQKDEEARANVASLPERKVAQINIALLLVLARELIDGIEGVNW